MPDPAKPTKPDYLKTHKKGCGCAAHKKYNREYMRWYRWQRTEAKRSADKERREFLIERAKAEPAEVIDFLRFRERFFGHQTNWYHQDAYERIESNDRLIMLLPPEHAKTTTWAIEYVTYKLMMNQDLRIVVIQKSQLEAKKIVASVKDRLTNHEFYQNLGIPIEADPITIYGGPKGFKPEREDGLSWAAEHFYLRGRSMAEKDPSLQAKGATSAILGNRIDLVIVDDIQDDKNFTAMGLEALKTWFTHSLMSRLGDITKKHSKVIVLGSRIGPGDFYEWLEQNYALIEGAEYPESEIAHRWPIVKYPAVLDEEKREILWPEYWTWEGLMSKKFEVKDKWWSNWMQVEGAAEDAAFVKEAMDRARDFERFIGRVYPDVDDIVVGCDPATSGYTAIFVEGLNRKTKQRHLIDLVNERGLRHWPNIIQKLCIVIDNVVNQGHSVRCLVIESRNVQDSLAEDPRLRQEMASRGVRVVTYRTAANTGAAAEERDFNISTLGDLFDADLWVLPYGDERSRRVVDEYIAQCLNWRPKPPGTTGWHLVRDMVMATLFAESEVRRIAKRETDRKPRRNPRVPAFAMDRWKRRQLVPAAP